MLGIVKNKNKNIKAFAQLSIMMSLTVLTQVIALIRSSVVAAQFGTGIEMDAFNFSNSIGTFIFSFIGAGVTTVLIPNLVNSEDEESGNIFISVLYSIAFILLVIVYLSRGFMVGILSNGGEEFITIACNIMLITLVTQFITSFMGATNAIFQCSGKYNFPKVVNLITAILLLVLVVFMNDLDIYKYAAYISITSLISVIIQIFLAIKGGYKYRFNLDINNKTFKNMLKIFIPIVLSSGLYQVSLMTDTIISANLGEGQVSILSYSNTIIGMINSILLTNIITYLYPKIAQKIDDDNSQNNLFDIMIFLNAIMCFILVALVIVGRDLVAVLYERGKFTNEITQVVTYCILIYAIGLPINAMRDLIYRYFYAKGDTSTPFKNSLIISFLNIIISILLSKIIGIYGIVIGTVITSYMSYAMILFRFNKKFKINYNKKILLVENIKIISISIIVILLVKLIIVILPEMNILLNIFIYGVLSLLIYILLLYIFKSKVRNIKL